MTYCPECGSKVETEDVFCPYCGISLDHQSNEFEATIMESGPPAISAADVSAPGASLHPGSVPPVPEIISGEVNSGLSSQTVPSPPLDDNTAVAGETIETRVGDTGEIGPPASEHEITVPNVYANEAPTAKSEEPDDQSNVEILEPIAQTESSSTSNLPRDESAPDLPDSVHFESSEPSPGPCDPLASLSRNNHIVGADEPSTEQPEDQSSEAPDGRGAEPPAKREVASQAEPEAEPQAEPESDQVADTPPAGVPAQSVPSAGAIPYTSAEYKQFEIPGSHNLYPQSAAAEPAPLSPEETELPPPILKPDLAVPEGQTPASRFDSVQIVSTADQPAVVEAAVSAAGEGEGRARTSPNMNGPDTDGRNKAKLKPLDEGTLLNSRYEIVRKIGGGGMGAVYLASDRNLGGVLRAVKEMVQSYIEEAQQDKAVSDFKRESLLLTSLEHNSIPTIFDYFYDEKEGRFYLVMKYISGGDLAGRLRAAPEGRLEEKSVVEWAIQIADVLDYLHNRQPPIVYRDLKPSNIMVDGNNGKAMLIDFGIARWINKEEKGVTAVGTMGYAPPELFSGNVEPRSDIYSLGSTMFHLLTGADPQSNPLLIFDFNKHPRPRQINPQLSDQIEQMVMRAVEYSADKRFASAAEMRGALSEHLENLNRGRVTFGAAGQTGASSAGASPVFCGFCGQTIVASDVFCPFCGSRQMAGAPSAAPVAPPKSTAKLFIVSTNDLNTPEFVLQKDNNLVGRRDPMSNIFPEVDLSKFDPQTKISRRHARIWKDGDSYKLEDLGSSNGTLLISAVESTKLTPKQPRALSHGDKIKMGDTTLHFLIT
jgi:eukaryotic-like serine/threonine-protein kinase